MSKIKVLSIIIAVTILFTGCSISFKTHQRIQPGNSSPATFEDARKQVMTLFKQGKLDKTKSSHRVLSKTHSFDVTMSGLEIYYSKFINVFSLKKRQISVSCEFKHIDEPIVVESDYWYEIPLGNRCNNLAVIFYFYDKRLKKGQEKRALSFAKALYSLKHMGDFSYRLVKQGQFEKAITAAKMVIEIKPDNAVAYNNIGYAYGKLERYDEAFKAFRKSMELNPQSDSVPANYGLFLLKKGDYKEAAKQYKKAVKLKPNNTSYLSGLTHAYYFQGRYDDALDTANRVVAISSIIGVGARIQIEENYPTVYSLFESGPADKAGIKVGDRIIRIDGKPTQGWKIKEVVSKLKGQEGTSVVLTIQPKSAEERQRKLSILREKVILKAASSLFAMRSLAQRHKGQNGNALKDAEQAYRLDSSNEWTKFSLGAARLDQGRYDEAIELLSQVKASTSARILEATARVKQGNTQKAVAIYSAIPEEKLSPNNIPLWSDRAALLTVFTPYVNSKQTSAVTLQSQGKYRQALEVLSDAIIVANDAQDSEIRKAMVRILRAVPQLAELPEEARKFALRGDMLTEEGNFKEAVDQYRQAVKAAPYIARLYFNTATVYGELKKYPQAIRYMNSYLQLASEAPNARAAKDQIYKWEFKMEKRQ